MRECFLSIREAAVRNSAHILLGGFVLLSGSCRSTGNLPATSSNAYADFVSTFYVGLAALQVGDDVRAETELAKATQIVPEEPSAWVNWGVLALRQQNLNGAAERLERARKLAPRNDDIYYLLGLVETNRGRSAEAISDLRKAVELNPKNLIATYRLAEETERLGEPNGDTEFQRIIQLIVDSQPDNLAALLELARVAAKRGDTATLKHAIARVGSRAQGWPPEVLLQLTAVEQAASGNDTRAAALRTTFLRNVLMRVPDFRQNLAAIKPPPGDEAQPLTHFLRLDTPVSSPAAPDTAMTFSAQPLPNKDNIQWDWIGAISLSGSGTPIVALANGSVVHLSTGAAFPFPGTKAAVPPKAESILPIDFNYDFKTDLILAGAGGVRFRRQESPETFTDVTALTKLPTSIVNGRYTGAWAVDIEADGDLDVVLGSSDSLPIVLRNNGDNTFTATYPFPGVLGIFQFAWADLNGDGNPDAALIDGRGKLHLFLNERSGRFREVPLPSNIHLVKAIAVADTSHNGALNLLVVQDDGAILRIAQAGYAMTWEAKEVGRVPDHDFSGEIRLRAADLDNNGAIDLLLAHVVPPAAPGSQEQFVWLGDQKGNFLPPEKLAAPPRVFDVADLNTSGRLDLLGLSSDGQPIQAVNRGSKGYHWQIIRPRARQATGDQRINSFGIGGEIEIRSGLLVQLQPLTGPQIHFGLGEQHGVDVARILWPNGSVRAEFALKADQQIVTEQRLKGSCPFLFAYDGREMKFVKDTVPWGSAIGLRIDSLGTARIAATEEWYKIGRDELAPHDGYYDLRITGELWETYYYDSLALMTVDHPAGTEVFADERFVIPPIKPAVIAVGEPHKVARALDDQGQDVTDIVRDLDDRYLDTFGRGQYQGLTRDHYVEVDLGDDVPTDAPLYLIAKGWLHPSDSSINVALGQGHHEPPHPISLEVPDGQGRWTVARANLGFPAGRKKICLFDLTNLFSRGAPHRVRIRTNLEIYWDSIEWAQGLPATPLKVKRLNLILADLHHRGYSVIYQQNDSSPEIPDYNHISGAVQRWRDLEGYYTRYGDVRELLAGVDDRYVIMNAGDEMSLRFPVQQEPAPGWVRDYVIAGDGWIKDGDYNSTYSETVLPLPHHDRTQYDERPGRLEDEWVYRHHPEDWQTYHTRYVAPEAFKNSLRIEAGK